MTCGKVAINGALSFFAILLVIRPSWSLGPFNTPVYDPASKSYFELIDGRDFKRDPNDEGPTWSTADSWAKQRTFKGVQGRLAVVPSIATHVFLEGTFQPDTDTWIGLRYWCARRILQWSDGQTLKPGSFQAWDKNWQQLYTCSGANPSPQGMRVYAGVAYTGVAKGFRWITEGVDKKYYYYFVEYPTGHP